MVADELRGARREFHVKFRGEVPEQTLLALRAQKIGTSSHEDRFYALRGEEAVPGELVRIRRDGEDEPLFTYKAPIAEGERPGSRVVVDRIATPQDLATLRAEYREVAVVAKQRTAYFLGDVRLGLDRVERLGSFVEIESGAGGAEAAYRFAAALGLDAETATSRTYLELALQAQKPLHRLLFALHDQFGRFTFGVSSAVMTTMGVVASLDAATDSRAAILGGIASIAVADSISDAFGIFSAKKAERGVSAAAAARSALGTLWGKAAIAGTFLLPFAFLASPAATYVAVGWGAALLVLVSAQISFVKEERFWKNALGNLAAAAAIVALARLVGEAVGRL